jgi:hypothetical protein
MTNVELFREPSNEHPTKLYSNWPSGFRQEIFKTDNTIGSCFVCVLPIKKIFLEDHPLAIPTKFGSNWRSGFKEEDLNLMLRSYYVLALSSLSCVCRQNGFRVITLVVVAGSL